MARSLLSILLALILAACGSGFALAQTEDEDPCATEIAGVAQVEDEEVLDGDDEFVDEEDDWIGDEEDWSEEDEDFVDDEFVDDEELLEDEFDDCGDFADDDEFADDSPDGEDSDSDGRTRRGTGGADRFIGDPGVNYFYGRGGDDYLDGVGGRDLLNGGPGDDTILTGKRKAGASKKRAKKNGADVKAGRGNDIVRSRNGRVDRIHCGKGKDSVVADRGDKVRERNCETVKYG